MNRLEELNNDLQELNNHMQELLDSQKKINEAIVKCDEEIEFGTVAEDDEMVKEASDKKSEYQQNLRTIEEKIQEVQNHISTLQAHIENVAKRETREAEVFKELSEKYPAQYDRYRIMAMSDEEAQAAIANIPDKSEELKNSLEQEQSELKEKNEATNSRLEQIEIELNQIKEEFKQTHDMSLKDKLMMLMEEKKNLIATKEQQDARMAEVSNQLENITPQKMTVEEYKKSQIKEIEGKYLFNRSKDYMNLFLENQEKLGKKPEQIVAELNEKTGIVGDRRYALSQVAEDQRYKDASDIIRVITNHSRVQVARGNTPREMTILIDRMLEEENVSENVKNTLAELKTKIEKYEKIQQEYSNSNENMELKEERNTAFEEAQKMICDLAVEALNTIKTIQEEKLGYSLLSSPDEKYSFEGLDRKTQENIKAYNEMLDKVGYASNHLIIHVEQAKREMMEFGVSDIVPYIYCMATVTDSKPGHYTEEDLEKYKISLKFFKNEMERATKDAEKAKEDIISKNKEITEKLQQDNPQMIEEENKRNEEVLPTEALAFDKSNEARELRRIIGHIEDSDLREGTVALGLSADTKGIVDFIKENGVSNPNYAQKCNEIVSLGNQIAQKEAELRAMGFSHEKVYETQEVQVGKKVEKTEVFKGYKNALLVEETNKLEEQMNNELLELATNAINEMNEKYRNILGKTGIVIEGKEYSLAPIPKITDRQEITMQIHKFTQISRYIENHSKKQQDNNEKNNDRTELNQMMSEAHQVNPVQNTTGSVK